MQAMSAEEAPEDEDPEAAEDEAERRKLVARLQAAAQNGEVKVVEKVLDCFGKDQDEHVQLALSQFLSSQDADGWTALHFACQGGTAAHTLIIRRLCKSKADVNVVDKQGWSPLHVAAQFAEEPILDILIQYLADRKLKDNNDMSPNECANGEARRLKLRLPESVLEELLVDVKKSVDDLQLVPTLTEEELMKLEKLEHHVQDQILRAQGDIDRRETRVKELMEEDLGDATMVARMNQVKNMVKFKKEVKNLKALMANASGLLTALREKTSNSHILIAVQELETMVLMFETKLLSMDASHMKKNKCATYSALPPHFERQIARGRKHRVSSLPGEMAGSDDEADHQTKKPSAAKEGTSQEINGPGNGLFSKREKVRVKDRWMTGWRSGRITGFEPLLIKVESMSQPSAWDTVEKIEAASEEEDEDGDGDIDMDDGHHATGSILLMARHLQDVLHDIADGEIDSGTQLELEKDIHDTIKKFNRQRLTGSIKAGRNRGEGGACAGNQCLIQ